MREEFEQWYLANRSCLDNKVELFDIDELGYVNERVWECFEAWKAACAREYRNGTA